MRRGLGRQSPDTDFSEGVVLTGAVHGATATVRTPTPCSPDARQKVLSISQTHFTCPNSFHLHNSRR